MICFPLFNEKFELEEFEWSKLKLELDFIQRWAWHKSRHTVHNTFYDRFRKYEKYINEIKNENLIEAYNSLEPATKEVFWCITEHDMIDDSSIEKNIDLDFFIDSSIKILIQKGLITARNDEDFYFYGSYVYSADERFSDIKKMIEDDKRGCI